MTDRDALDKLIEAAALGEADTLSGLAEEAGISRAHLYRLLRDPATVGELRRGIHDLLSAAAPLVLARLARKALSGHVPAARALIEAARTSAPPASDEALLKSMSPAELQAYLAQSARRLLGSENRVNKQPSASSNREEALDDS